MGSLAAPRVASPSSAQAAVVSVPAKTVTLSRGVVVDSSAIEDTLKKLARLSAHQRVALHELTTHARDAGFPLAKTTIRILSAVGIEVENNTVAHETRAIVADAARGFGLAISIFDPVTGKRIEPAGEAVPSPKGTVPMQFLAGPVTRAEQLIQAARAFAKSGDKFNEAEMRAWVAAASTLRDEHGRRLPALQKAITAVASEVGDKIGKKAYQVFLDLVADSGAELEGKKRIPLRQRPYWLKEANPLQGFQSSPELPQESDVVIIGGGWVGATAALYLAELAEQAQRPLSVTVIEGGEVAGQATGRNGGNLESIPENFPGAYGTYDGYPAVRYQFLKRAYPEVPDDVLRKQADRIADTVLRFGFKNAQLLSDTIQRHNLKADLSTAGWLRIALNKREEAALVSEVKRVRALGADIHVIGPKTIYKRYKLRTKYRGRITYGNGNFHPFKLVAGCMSKAIEKGVGLYTNTQADSIQSVRPDLHLVKTPRGTIRAKKVIVATNAFTSRLLPQLGDIKYFHTQTMNYNHTKNPLDGITFTAKDGDIYASFPRQDWYVDKHGVRRGTLHIGGGKDTEGRDPYKAKPKHSIVTLSSGEAAQIFPDTKDRHPVRSAAGPMAFVEGKHGMRMAAIGTLAPSGPESGVAVGIWCNGYGTTGCQKTGYELAQWAWSGKFSADVPEDVFGLRRILTDEPLFDPVHAGPRKT